jgi:hypothetical protein
LIGAVREVHSVQRCSRHHADYIIALLGLYFFSFICFLVFDDLDANSLKLFREEIEVIFTDRVVPGKANYTCWFEFSPSSGVVIGIQLAHTDLECSLEYFALVLFSDTFEIVLLQFVLRKLEVIVDVKGSHQDAAIEIEFVVEGFCLVMIDELYFDYASLAIDLVLFDFRVFLAVLEKHIDHLVLDSLLYILYYQFLTVLDFLFDCFFHIFWIIIIINELNLINMYKLY